MKVLNAIRCFGAAGLIAVTTSVTTSTPASAQVGDFLCSTLSIGCPPPPPPPPPAPVVEEPAAPVKKVRKKARKKSVAKKKAAEETQ